MNGGRPGQTEARRVFEERAREAGFDLVGVTRAEPLREGGERLREWQQAGMAADMGYMHRPVETPEEREERGLPRRLLLSGRPSRERGWRQGSAIRVGPGLPRDHKGAVVQAEGGARGGARRQDKSPRVHRRRTAPGTFRGPARGARVLRAELLPDKQRDRVVLLYRRPDRRPRPRSRPARRGDLWTLQALHGPLPYRRHKGPRRRGRQALYLLPDDREPG